MREPDLSRFIVVLSRAEEAGNVGAACRAMKTMGIGRLALVGPFEYDAQRVATMAVHAFDVYERALRFPELANALAGTSLSAGFTRRRGGRRKTFSIAVDDFAKTAAARQPDGDIALVFGNEKSGLSGEELALCSVAVHIPTSGDFPSLNLAQAVQIACWELRRQAPGLLSGSYRAADRSDIASMVERAALRLGELGFFRLNQGEELRVFLRDLGERAALSTSELAYFEAFIHKMAGLAGKKGP
jgi:TrmH family RNA methyltransferase